MQATTKARNIGQSNVTANSVVPKDTARECDIVFERCLLSTELSHLEEIANEVVRRLAPVMRESEDPETGGEIQEYRAPLASEIRNERLRVTGLRTLLESVNRRLEL